MNLNFSELSPNPDPFYCTSSAAQAPHCVGQTIVHRKPEETSEAYWVNMPLFFFFLIFVVSICKADLMHSLTALNL